MNRSKQANRVAQPQQSELILSLKHLQAEFARIDILIQREVRRWRLAGQDPHDDYRGMYVSEGEVEILLQRPFGLSWGQTVVLESAETQLFADAEAQARAQAQTITATMSEQGQIPRLLQIVDTFGLDQFELDVLLLCLAPAFDPRYDRLFGYLQDNVNRRRPMIRLILNVLGQPGPEQFLLSTYFAATAPLFKYKLLSHVTETGTANPHWINQTLQADETIVAWLMGRYQPAPALEDQAELLQPTLTATDHLLSNSVWSLSQPIELKPILAFHGPDTAAQQATAQRLAVEQKRALLAVDLAAIIDGGISPLQAVNLALRDARLTQAIPYLTGWTACLNKDRQPIVPALMQSLCDYPDLLIVASETTWQPLGLDRQRPLLWSGFPKPTYAQRRALWFHFLGMETEEIGSLGGWQIKQSNNGRSDQSPADHAGVQDLASKIDLVAGQFVLTSGQIRDAVASARDLAFGREQELGVERQGLAASASNQSPTDYSSFTMTSSDLFIAARTLSSPRLSGLARKITPRYSWDDIILPRDQVAILRELVATVRGRPQVLEGWGVGQKLASSSGVTVLFAGPPGTGKTMSAEVIAGELGLDLYKIDLSSVVSKYIGETEKNLERIFNEAESSNAILFFDEADALFGKRSEVKDSHDRYANIEISYLLQRMETYDGVTILATNLGGNMDEAFTRRLQFVVDFPMPSAADQQRIWETLLPTTVPRQPDLDFSLLTERFDLAGGNIRNILVTASFLAAADGGEVTMAHLLHGTRRELQKMGRLVEEEDLILSM